MTAAEWSLGAAGPVLAAEGRRDETWRERAACGPRNADLFFGPHGETTSAFQLRTERAKAVCARCPVQAECLAEAMRAEAGTGFFQRDGVYGGLTHHERYQLDKARVRPGRRPSDRSAKAPSLVPQVPELTDAELARFDSMLQPSSCGVRWSGPAGADGRARFRRTRQNRIGAARIAYKRATGTDPGWGIVLQRCGDYLCMTPACLYLATNAEARSLKAAA